MAPQKNSRYRWFVVGVFFFFIMLHQTDKLMIGPMQQTIEDQFGITDREWGYINSGAIAVATLLYPVWGYLYDRYARAKLLALASFIWGATTWISALAPNYRAFLVTRASTGIDDSAYPGLYSLVADYFGPNLRGKIYGLLQLAQPIGYLTGMIISLMVAPLIGGWRSAFFLTGSLGLVIAVLIYFGVRDLPRGQAEPEFENKSAEAVSQFHFSWKEAGEIFRRPTMWFIFAQGFAGVIPWNVITYFFFGYLMAERGYDNNNVLSTMVPVVLLLASGYFVGGFLGDIAFKLTHKGRIFVSSVGVFLGAIFLYLAINTPLEDKGAFFLWLCLTAIFMPISSPNVIATVYDITVPEVRSTAQAIEYFVENIGAAAAPAMAGTLSVLYGKGNAILWICIIAWAFCFVIYLGALFTIDRDIHNLRAQMAERAKTM